MARALAASLAETPFTVVLTSPLRRAQQTCELAGLQDQSLLEPDLAEWDYGEYEGLRSIDIRVDRSGWDIWTDGCPGGESTSAISERADRLLLKLSGYSGNVALFSHGQFSRVLAARWIGLPVAHGRHLAFDPACYSLLSRDAYNWLCPMLAIWNKRPQQSPSE